MNHDFDEQYWATHWNGPAGSTPSLPAHPALEDELTLLRPGTALDAGSGQGAEAAWLAGHGWEVTAVDISAHALTRAAMRPAPGVGVGSVTWVAADLTQWAPGQQFDLVTTFYAHPAIAQHAFYERISEWVAPGGTLLIVGHHDSPEHGHSHAHPENAVTTPEQIHALLAPDHWKVRTAEVRERAVTMGSGHSTALRDVIGRAERI
ncbi:class I SAM-dependent methyltransferase [Microbacterium terregens]|uniref:Class I SAM-dependent methyltransferase n=1 Tax=Microbacterium terregens TaxID=69363 RepID=A0ABV5T3S7_9MICO